MKAKYKHKLLVLVVAFIMFISILPTNAFAEQNANTAIDASDFSTIKETVDNLAASGTDKSGTIRITSDIAYTDKITIPAGVRLTIISDSNSHSISKASASSSTTLFEIEAGASLTIDGSLTFTATNAGTGLFENHGELTLESGTLDFNDITLNAGEGIVSVDGSKASFTMNGGTIKNANINACCGAVRICSGGSFTMNGGTISDIKAPGKLEAGGVLVFACSSSSLGNGTASFTMNGGTIENNTGYRGAGVFVIGRDYVYRASFTMNGGIIRNNTCTCVNNDQSAGGGVYVQQNAEFTMNAGEISGNSVTGGEGGGVCAACGWESVKGTPGWTIERFSRYYPASFTMNGGTISGNRATKKTSQGDNGCGGGVYIASNCVTLNAGTIENNYAEKQGGGVYVGATPYVLKIHNAVVTENHATILGGGLWACPTGDINLSVTNGAALFDNSSDGAGDDVVSVKLASSHSISLSDRALGGGQVFWYKDGGVSSDSILGYPDNSARYSTDNTASALNPIQDYEKSIALKAVMSNGAKAAATEAATLVIRGNESARGGGIGTNGGIILGDDQEYDYSLQVKKTWTDTENSQKTAIKVSLKLGDNVIDTAELNEDNDWTHTFTGLADPKTLEPLSYTIVEDPVPSGFTPSYTTTQDDDARIIYITVNNKYTPTGNLTVSKLVSGNAGDTSKEFSFTVKLSDNTINGTYGDMTFVNGTATFTLKHNEKKSATGLPAGITYVVIEDDANQNGYTTISTGASGSILQDQTVTATFTNTKDSVKTGDENNMGLWLALMLISCAAFASVCVYKKISYTGHHTKR